MRLTQIKLAGFKSFVDPTSIPTPGQLVGIVGPNGCGKSNVIDAVRWVLGESKASALRGESMQDVIFNGAGERKPIGRAAVELLFDNSAGRIGGQWASYAEMSIKRVLTRDGDSTYYINNQPVRRRDIHDLFLGTGLGPRAYAIIEQGMISRVVEAKPEELRVFLEEAAGVSKYRERRKETEGRLSDTRENLSRVEDIRNELGNQLERLEHQAKVAGEFRELETRLRTTQHLLWYAKQQDAARQRERHAAEVVTLGTALEALVAEVREAEARIEALRAEHYKAGDALHDRQGAYYAANAEVTRLEQQLSFARESETRIVQQVSKLNEQLVALATQESGLAGDRSGLDAMLEEALRRAERTLAEEQAAQHALPALEQALQDAAQALATRNESIVAMEQAIRVSETRRDSASRALEQLRGRHAALQAEFGKLAVPATDPMREVEEQLAQERGELAGRDEALAALQASVQSLLGLQRDHSGAWSEAGKALADLEGRQQALSALQARVGHGEDRDAWLASAGLAQATPLWRDLEVEPGWNDALEAVLRERLEALELRDLADALAWSDGNTSPPMRLALFVPGVARHAPSAAGDALLDKVRVKRVQVGRILADALHGVRCRDSLAAALADRDALGLGEAFVTPQGHLVGAQTVTLFKPDGEIHGVLERQRELERLAVAIVEGRERVAAARVGLDAIEADLKARQQDYHAESQAVASQQRRVHDLDLELAQMKQAAEAAARRREELGEEADALSQQVEQDQRALEALQAEIADLQSRIHDEYAGREALRHARNEADVARERGREALRQAERARAEADFEQRSARDRLSDLERRHEALAQSTAQQRAQLEALTIERASIDWTPVDASLQQQLGTRGEAEAQLTAAREAVDALGAALREAEEARMAAEQKLEPARTRIQDVRMKEQAATLAEAQFTEQLTEAHADVAPLPEALKAFGPRSQLPGEIERLQQAIAELGAVNLAALDELNQARERKEYLDAQAADLNEAMSTLEAAIRQIDRESRELLKQTFDVVNENFGKLFPTLFGGGQARLVLTGEEILDSGVQVIAQPPGKRNTSIHLLSGGEKALTATSLVFALFQINPAPFCLLDEVDAPLDDSNTERFCSMVRDMSAQTQFLFISHNKITMEMASQLVGITMPEPGISRVVAVDIAEAVQLASSAAVRAAA